MLTAFPDVQASDEMNTLSYEALHHLATDMRIDILRMIHAAASGHPGGSLSLIDLLTVLFYRHVRRTPDNVLDPDRNRVVLSKGHGVPALYAVLSRLGVIEQSSLMSLRTLGSPLQGHPHNVSLPAVEASTGSLGQGLSMAQGMAMAAKLDGRESRVYCIIGDGEFQEGQIWEALMSSAKFGLDNLIVILDYNKSQIDGKTRDVMNIDPVDDKIAAFNWAVERIDGHDYQQIDAALTRALQRNGKPHFIIADTIKGKGVSFMEQVVDWHGKAPDDAQLAAAITELQALRASQAGGNHA